MKTVLRDRFKTKKKRTTRHSLRLVHIYLVYQLYMTYTSMIRNNDTLPFEITCLMT